jgi:exopolysaccharide biosynthesis polyprenyl glycosylphosphotransferase
MISRNKFSLLSFFLLVVPTLVIFGISLWLTLSWRYPSGLSHEQLNTHILLFGIISLIWLILYYAFGLLDLKTHRQPIDLITSLIGAHSLGLVVAVVFFYFQPTLIITPRRFLLVDTLCIFILSSIWQFLIRSMTKRVARQTVYFINLEREFQEYKDEFDKQSETLEIRSIPDSELLSLTEKTHRTHQSFIFVVPSTPNFSTETLELFAHLHAHGATFIRFNDFYEETFRRVYTSNLNDWWLLEHTHRDQSGLYPLVKRFFDFIFGSIIGLVFLLTLPFVFLLIKLSDRGKIFFTQTRLSVNGAPFTIYKYRTMREGTPNNTWTADHDPRVTPVGRFLRTTRLDELPQWINILRGDMSLIGPRPEQAGIVEQLKNEVPYFESRHAIRPGLIGWAQLHVYAGNATESKRKLQYDLYYLKNRSFLFDLEILLKTIAHVFFLKGK